VHRRRVLILAAAALLAGLLFVLWPRTRAPSSPAAPTVTEPHRATVVGSAPVAEPAPTPIVTLGGPTEERLRRNLDEYKKVAVYPPWSRAFDRGTRQLLQWNKPSTVDLPMDDRPGRETTYHFDADRAHVAYGEAITSWIEVWKQGNPQERLPVTVENASVMATSGPHSGRTLELRYHDDGQDGDAVAGDLRYTNRFVPSSVPELKQSLQVHLMATVSCCDGVRRAFMRDFTYAPRQPLQIVGVGDGIRDGSLAISLAVDVVEAGVYAFEANLVSGDGMLPIGYSHMNYTLAPGRQSVDLMFFGRMFAQVGVDGPYQVRDIRGQLLFLDGSEQNLWFTYPTPYLTRAYRRSDFSAAEWDGPEKREKIAIMQKLIGDTASGRIGAASAEPQHIEIDQNGVEHVVKDPPPPKK
jgi:uncharacterized protein DUF4784